MARIAVMSACLTGVLSACAGSNSEGSASNDVASGVPATASTSAEALGASIFEIGEIVNIGEDNDPNDLIGRPNGYDAAAVLYDNRAKCQNLSVDCGATVE